MARPSRLWATAKPGLRVLRDGWLIIGLALLLLIALEVAYRAQGAVRRVLAGAGIENVELAAAHPYNGQSWWQQWQKRDGSVELYDPYRGWWPGPVSGPLLNVDSAGRRATIGNPSSGATRRVLMLGGSTMWGYTARDEFTIPSLTAQELRRRGAEDVEVLNLAQPAYTATQELITLMLELRRGAVPDVVVFLDGNNEVATTVQSGRVGRIFGEARAAQRMELGGRTLLSELVGLGRHLELVDRVGTALRGAGSGGGVAAPPPTELCPTVAEQYLEVAQMATALGQAYGFRSVFLWQPLRATTRKPLTDWEASIGSRPGYRDMLVECTVRVDELAVERSGIDFHQLAGLFNDDTAAVFLDEYGHITEAANAKVARHIARLVLDRLDR